METADFPPCTILICTICAPNCRVASFSMIFCAALYVQSLLTSIYAIVSSVATCFVSVLLFSCPALVVVSLLWSINASYCLLLESLRIVASWREVSRAWPMPPYRRRRKYHHSLTTIWGVPYDVVFALLLVPLRCVRKTAIFRGTNIHIMQKEQNVCVTLEKSTNCRLDFFSTGGCHFSIVTPVGFWNIRPVHPSQARVVSGLPDQNPLTRCWSGRFISEYELVAVVFYDIFHASRFVFRFL